MAKAPKVTDTTEVPVEAAVELAAEVAEPAPVPVEDIIEPDEKTKAEMAAGAAHLQKFQVDAANE